MKINKTDVRTATIASGGNLSTPIEIEGAQILGFIMPAEWTSANLTFKASDTFGGTYQDIYDDSGIEVSVTVAAQGTCIGISVAALALAGFSYIKIRSGTAAVPVNQAAARVIKVNCKQ